MDKVRFGRALGKGARAAASSVWEAAEAAAAPDPRNPPNNSATRNEPATPAARAASTAAATVIRAQRQAGNVRRSAQAARPGVFAPVRKFSSVLWLEITGTFFTLIAAFLAQGVWRLRGSARAPISSAAAHKFYGYLLIFLLFAWFAVSSFVRARKRSRR